MFRCHLVSSDASGLVPFAPDPFSPPTVLSAPSVMSSLEPGGEILAVLGGKRIRLTEKTSPFFMALLDQVGHE